MKHQRTFTLRGRLWADPEQMSSNVVKVPVVVTESYKDREGEWQEKTEWFKPVAFGKQAALAYEHLRKGMSVEIVGSLQNRQYEKNGEKHYAMDLVVEEITPILEIKASKPQAQSNQPRSRGSDDQYGYHERDERMDEHRDEPPAARPSRTNERQPPTPRGRDVADIRDGRPKADAPPLGMKF